MTAGATLYEGHVTHSRLEPFKHAFRYRVFYGLFDIDRLGELDNELRWFSVGRFNLFGFDEADHGPADGSPLRPWVEETLERAGVSLDGGRVELLAFPRILGYVFNPLSIWFCHGPDGELRAVIHEVRNTFGDRHNYVVPVVSEGLRHSFDKMMHVSPFNGMDQTYRFALTEPGSRLSVSIEETEGGIPVLRAGMALARREMTDASLLRMFFSHPLLTLKVISTIHWQALRLWARGARFHRRPQPLPTTTTIVDKARQSA